MRPIKFRAKHHKTGLWIEGAFIPATANTPPMIYTPAGDCHAVNEDTVGQFTGLQDVMKHEIFEGDIAVHENKSFIVVYQDDAFELYDFDGWESLYYAVNTDDITIIGNIHDNSELAPKEGAK